MLAVEQTQNKPAAIKIFSTERIHVGVGGFSPAGWQIFANGAVSTIGKIGNHYCRIRKLEGGVFRPWTRLKLFARVACSY